MKISRLFLPFLLAIAGCATQNPPAKIDMERQAEIKKALEQLKSENGRERENAVRILETLNAKECIEDFARLLKDKDEWVRDEVVVALGHYRAREYAKAIAGLLKDEDKHVRVDAIWALGELQTKEYTDNIKTLLNDESEAVRNEAKRVLKEWGYDIEKIKEQKSKSKDMEKNAK